MLSLKFKKNELVAVMYPIPHDLQFQHFEGKADKENVSKYFATTETFQPLNSDRTI